MNSIQQTGEHGMAVAARIQRQVAAHCDVVVTETPKAVGVTELDAGTARNQPAITMTNTPA